MAENTARRRTSSTLLPGSCVVKKASAKDGRGQVLTITRAGRALRRKIWPVYAAAVEAAVGAHLSAAEARTLGDLLAKLY